MSSNAAIADAVADQNTSQRLPDRNPLSSDDAPFSE
jgi:hypothetical protein